MLPPAINTNVQYRNLNELGTTDTTSAYRRSYPVPKSRTVGTSGEVSGSTGLSGTSGGTSGVTSTYKRKCPVPKNKVTRYFR